MLTFLHISNHSCKTSLQCDEEVYNIEICIILGC